MEELIEALRLRLGDPGPNAWEAMWESFPPRVREPDVIGVRCTRCQSVWTAQFGSNALEIDRASALGAAVNRLAGLFTAVNHTCYRVLALAAAMPPPLAMPTVEQLRDELGLAPLWMPTATDREVLRIAFDRLEELGAPETHIPLLELESDSEAIADHAARLRYEVAAKHKADPTIAELLKQLTPQPDIIDRTAPGVARTFSAMPSVTGRRR